MDHSLLIKYEIKFVVKIENEIQNFWKLYCLFVLRFFNKPQKSRSVEVYYGDENKMYLEFICTTIRVGTYIIVHPNPIFNVNDIVLTVLDFAHIDDRI